MKARREKKKKRRRRNRNHNTRSWIKRRLFIDSTVGCHRQRFVVFYLSFIFLMLAYTLTPPAIDVSPIQNSINCSFRLYFLSVALIAHCRRCTLCIDNHRSIDRTSKSSSLTASDEQLEWQPCETCVYFFWLKRQSRVVSFSSFSFTHRHPVGVQRLINNDIILDQRFIRRKSHHPQWIFAVATLKFTETKSNHCTYAHESNE